MSNEKKVVPEKLLANANTTELQKVMEHAFGDSLIIELRNIVSQLKRIADKTP